MLSLIQSLNYNIPTRIRSQDSGWSYTRPSKPTGTDGQTAMLIIANAIENKEKNCAFIGQMLEIYGKKSLERSN